MSSWKLFIGGLSWESNEDSLRTYFGAFGRVSDCVIMRDRHSGHPRGFGFVSYDDEATADRVAADRHELDGRQVEAKRAVPRSECTPAARTHARATKKVFVGGLPATCGDREFYEYFARFGDIAESQVMYDFQTRNSRGFGFVTFSAETTVERVVNMDHDIMGKMVEVKRAEPKQVLEARRNSPPTGVDPRRPELAAGGGGGSAARPSPPSPPPTQQQPAMAPPLQMLQGIPATMAAAAALHAVGAYPPPPPPPLHMAGTVNTAAAPAALPFLHLSQQHLLLQQQQQLQQQRFQQQQQQSDLECSLQAGPTTAAVSRQQSLFAPFAPTTRSAWASAPTAESVASGPSLFHQQLQLLDLRQQCTQLEPPPQQQQEQRHATRALSHHLVPPLPSAAASADFHLASQHHQQPHHQQQQLEQLVPLLQLATKQRDAGDGLGRDPIRSTSTNGMGHFAPPGQMPAELAEQVHSSFFGSPLPQETHAYGVSHGLASSARSDRRPHPYAMGHERVERNYR
jgi:RNA recognition motif-containing protein